MVKERLPKFAGIKWSTKLYCTENFWKVTTDAARRKDLSLFPRNINPLLVLKDGKVVLPTAFELDRLLPFWWHRALDQAADLACTIDHLSLTTKGLGLGGHQEQIDPKVFVSIKLFRGYVDYSDEEKAILEDMLFDLPNPESTVEELLNMRNRLGLFERSDLESVTYRLSTNGLGYRTRSKTRRQPTMP